MRKPVNPGRFNGLVPDLCFPDSPSAQTDRQTDTHTDTQTDRQTHRQTDINKDRNLDRQTEICS